MYCGYCGHQQDDGVFCVACRRPLDEMPAMQLISAPTGRATATFKVPAEPAPVAVQGVRLDRVADEIAAPEVPEGDARPSQADLPLEMAAAAISDGARSGYPSRKRGFKSLLFGRRSPKR